MRSSKERELKSKINKVKTIKKKLLKRNNKFITIDSYECNLNDGRVLIRDKINKGKKDGSAVTMLPVMENGDVLLVIQPRVFTDTTVGVEIPAGYVETNENSESAARRELLEEAGLESTNMKKLCGYYQDDGCSGAYVEGFLATGCKKVAEQKLDKDEYIELFICTIEEMYELVDRGIISGVNSQFVIEKAKDILNRL